MKKTIFFPIILLGVLLLSSCKLPRDLVYFQDLANNQTLFGSSVKVPYYKIRPFDNLYINIQTLDTDVNQLFNPSQGNNFFSGTQQMYGDLSSQYINGYLVEADGTISFPIIGIITVSGLTLIEAQNRIKARAMEYLKEPMVKVKILSFKVNVTGEVRNPGLYYNYQGKINVLEAISMAGGITDFAKIDNVVVIRQGKFNTHTHTLDFTSKSVFESDAFYLQPNDLVYIPPRPSKNTQINASTYSLGLSAISTILIVFGFIGL